eukprot:m.1656982 g.1656982  ORF g.1656982 m.1656982 type:complete len:62 (+) comp110058_c0_seq1:113-298(+)
MCSREYMCACMLVCACVCALVRVYVWVTQLQIHRLIALCALGAFTLTVRAGFGWLVAKLLT